MLPIRFRLVRVVLPIASLCAFAAASGLGVHALSSRAAGPQSASPGLAPETSPASGAPSTTTLTVLSAGSAVTSVAAGTAVTLAAQVSVTATHAALKPGLVMFCDATAARCEDSAIVGTGQLTPAGKATFKFVPGRGTHSYQALFVGTHAFAPSNSGPVTLSVGKHLSTTTVTASGPVGTATLAATVTGFDLSALTGEVVFQDITDAVQLGTVSLGSATSSQTFSSYTFSEGGNGGTYPSSLLLADVNGDGIKDLVTVQQPSSGPSSLVVVQAGKGDGTFGTGVTVYAGSAVSVAAGDFNGDGVTDLAVGTGLRNSTTQDSLGVTVLLGQGGGTFTVQKPIVLDTSSDGSLAMVVADVNGDGIADLIAGSGSTLYVLFGTGAGNFSIASKTLLPSPLYSLYSQDLNGDGVPDLIGIDESARAFVCLGDASGTFTFLGNPGLALSAAVADFNGDGIPDLALADGAADGTVMVLLGNGDGTFTLRSTPNGGHYPNAIVAADLNGDGIEDLVVNNDFNTVLLLGAGDGTFKAALIPVISPATIDAQGFATADLTGDGLTDVLGYGGTGFFVALNGITATAQATLSSVSVPKSPAQYVTAAFSGDMETAPSLSASVALNTILATTTLRLSASPTASAYGNVVNLTATLSPYSLPGATSDGDVVTFYSGASSIGKGTLSSGVATFKTTYLPVGADQLTAVFASDGNFAASTSNTVTETVKAGSGTTPNLVVTVNTDDAVGAPENCAGQASSNCSLRDAMAAAKGAGSGNITFSPVVFAASQPMSARTISLNAVLILPSNTTVTGPTTGSGKGLTQLVTLTPLNDTAIEVNKGTTGAAISGLAISGGNFPGPVSRAEAVRTDGVLSISDSAVVGNSSGGDSFGSAAIDNDVDGMLTLTNCNVSDNFAFDGGGGITNEGIIVITGSTISGNATEDDGGAGIGNSGTATLTDTTVSGNQAGFHFYGGRGGGIYNSGTLSLVDSSITGNGAANPGDGSGIYNNGTLNITRSSIVSNLTNYNRTYDDVQFPAVEDDCDGPGCPPEKIPAPPVFTPPSGTYSYYAFNPAVTDTTPGTVIFFTTDGSTPTTSSMLIYDGEPLYVGAGVVKAIAFANGEASAVATATYTIATGACTLIDYSSGFTPAALTLNGGATVHGSVLQLTDGGFNEARSAFYSTPVPVSEFTADFQFQLLYPFADGITFTIQAAGPHAVGQPGGGLGYAGIPKSVALKFDLFNNNGEGFDSVGYYVDGAYPSTPALNLFPYGINLHSGHIFAEHITYIGGVTTGTITDLTTYQSFSASVPGDLTKLVGNKAYVGFTGGTGLLTSTQNILTWTYGGGSGCGTSSAP